MSVPKQLILVLAIYATLGLFMLLVVSAMQQKMAQYPARPTWDKSLLSTETCPCPPPDKDTHTIPRQSRP